MTARTRRSPPAPGRPTPPRTRRPAPHPAPGPVERLTGTGRVTIARTGGGAGPDWGAYVLAYTTRPLPGSGMEAIVTAMRPETSPAEWGLRQPHTRFAPAGSARRPLWAYAAAATPPQSRSESAAAYEQRLAAYLLTAALGTRTVRQPVAVDLPRAAWTVDTEQFITFDAPRVSHTAIRIGRLITAGAA